MRVNLKYLVWEAGLEERKAYWYNIPFHFGSFFRKLLLAWGIPAIIIMQASLIANCVFNAFLPFTAMTFNIATILALRKPLTIPRALKVLLLSLAVSDLGVGLLVQPLYITSLVMLIKENTQTRTFEITLNFVYATGNFLLMPRSLAL